MALSITTLTTGSSSTANTVYTTATVVPSVNTLLLFTVSVYSSSSATNPATPTITGNGLTWELIDKADPDALGTDRSTIFVFRSMASVSTPGAITMTFVGSNQSKVCWTLDEVSGVKTTGANGSGAIAQSQTAVTAAADVSLSATFTNPLTSGNLGWAAFQVESTTTNTFTAGSGWTTQSSSATQNYALAYTQTETADNTISASWSVSGRAGLVAIEITQGNAPTVSMSDTQSVQTTVATTFDSAGDISVVAGDLVVACGATGDSGDTISFSGGGLTWTQRVVSNVNTSVAIWTAPASSSNTFVATMTRSGSHSTGITSEYYVISGASASTGATATDNGNGSYPQKNITTTGTDSLIVALSTDVGATASSAATWLTGAGRFISYLDDFSNSLMYIHTGVYTDVETTGTYTIGQSAPTPQIFDFAALEVKSLTAISPVAVLSWIRG
jgi:hypothetical protein